ncbi:MAG: hypothetical protein ACK55I_05885, partial [bacterium]
MGGLIMSGRNSNRNSRQLAQTIMSWMGDSEDIDWGVANPKPTITGPKPPQLGGFPSNPVIVKGPKKPKQPKGPKKPN